MKQPLEFTRINYKWLDTATAYYDRSGFTPIEVPWMVDSKYSKITAPEGSYFATKKPAQHLIGSAEQSFLQLASTGKIMPEIRYQAITPCFRQDAPDETHSRWFMKLELFECFEHPILDDVKVKLEAGYFRSHAYNFFETLINVKKLHVMEIMLEDGTFDFTLNGIEIGSYGIRCHKKFTWVYGTGLALPRFNYAMNYDGL